jgi:hypothetical protein
MIRVAISTSLAIAPELLVAQQAEIVDLGATVGWGQLILEHPPVA